MNITFIGNCQTASLCFYFQSLLSGKDYNVSWILYGDEFRQHLGSWIEKCQNKILEYEQAIEQITRSDIIIYQEISTEKSLFCNTATLQEHSKESCIFIKIPSIFLDYNHYSESIQGLEKREHTNNVDIIVSDILKKYPNDQEKLMLTDCHPTTFLFLEVMKKICDRLHIEFFEEDKYNDFCKNDNYMDLPYPTVNTETGTQ